MKNREKKLSHRFETINVVSLKNDFALAKSNPCDILSNCLKATLIVLLLAIFPSCTKKPTTTVDGSLKVVATIFPLYDWTRELTAGTDTELTLLLDSGVDLHSYQPSVQDMARLSVADIFVYVGGESDEWVRDALKTVRNKNMRVINLLEVLGDQAKAEEIVEGMQADDEEEADSADDDEEIEYDEHVWLSVRNARLFCAALTDALCATDAPHAETYRANCAAYDTTLSALDAAYTQAVASAQSKTLLFGDRFPFRYLADDYGLSYYAAFSGCSAETEASFKTIAFLSGKVSELGLQSVLQIESSDGKIPRTIIQNSANPTAQILTLDSMQSVTAKQIAAGASYVGIMEKNLAVLQEALQ